MQFNRSTCGVSSVFMYIKLNNYVEYLFLLYLHRINVRCRASFRNEDIIARPQTSSF